MCIISWSTSLCVHMGVVCVCVCLRIRFHSSLQIKKVRFHSSLLILTQLFAIKTCTIVSMADDKSAVPFKLVHFHTVVCNYTSFKFQHGRLRKCGSIPACSFSHICVQSRDVSMTALQMKKVRFHSSLLILTQLCANRHVSLLAWQITKLRFH